MTLLVAGLVRRFRKSRLAALFDSRLLASDQERLKKQTLLYEQIHFDRALQKRFVDFFPEWRSSTLLKLVNETLHKETPITDYHLSYKEDQVLLLNGKHFNIESLNVLTPP